jgi:hypothetical protein
MARGQTCLSEMVMVSKLGYTIEYFSARQNSILKLEKFQLGFGIVVEKVRLSSSKLYLRMHLM